MFFLLTMYIKLKLKIENFFKINKSQYKKPLCPIRTSSLTHAAN